MDNEEVINFSDEKNYNMDVFTVQPNDDENNDNQDDGLENNPSDKNIDDPDLNKEKEESVVNKDSGKDEESDSSSVYSSLANALMSEGILSESEPDKIKEIKDVESLMKAFNEEISRREFADLNEDEKEYLKAIRKGIPHEVVKENFNVQKELDSISDDELSSEDSESLRLEIIKQEHLSKGYSEERATKLAQRSVDIGEDIEDAKQSLEYLRESNKQALIKEQEKLAAKALEEEEKRKQDLIDLKKNIDTNNEIIKGLKVSQTQKEKLYEQMTKPAKFDKNGSPISAIHLERQKDPMGFEIKLNYLFQLTNGFNDFEKLVKISKSEAVKELDEKLKGNTFGFGSSGNVSDNVKNGDQFKGFGEELGEIID